MSIGLFEAFQIQLQVEYQNIINAQLGCSTMGLEPANKDLQTNILLCLFCNIFIIPLISHFPLMVIVPTYQHITNQKQ
jgi:hypothetical protein